MAFADNVIARAGAGDERALEEVLARLAPVLRAAISIPRGFRSVVSPDDILQLTFIDVFQKIEAFEFRGWVALRAWGLTIARRNLADALRGLSADRRGGGRVPASLSERSRGAEDGCQVPSRAVSPSHAAWRSELRGAVHLALRRLPEPSRTVLRLLDLEHRSVHQVAARLGKTPCAVHMIRLRALERARVLLGDPARWSSVW